MGQNLSKIVVFWQLRQHHFRYTIAASWCRW